MVPSRASWQVPIAVTLGGIQFGWRPIARGDGLSREAQKRVSPIAALAFDGLMQGLPLELHRLGQRSAAGTAQGKSVLDVGDDDR